MIAHRSLSKFMLVTLSFSIRKSSMSSAVTMYLGKYRMGSILKPSNQSMMVCMATLASTAEDWKAKAWRSPAFTISRPILLEPKATHTIIPSRPASCIASRAPSIGLGVVRAYEAGEIPAMAGDPCGDCLLGSLVRKPGSRHLNAFHQWGYLLQLCDDPESPGVIARRSLHVTDYAITPFKFHRLSKITGEKARLSPIIGTDP